MNCPNCGADLPEGSTFCSICQSPVGDAQSAVNDALFNGAPVYAAEPAKKKAPVLGIVIGIVAIVAIAFLLIFFVLGGRYNGTYMLDSMSADGMTITADDLSAFGMTNFGIKISFGKCEFVGGEDYGFDEAGTSKIKISGGKVTITDTDGTTATGTFDGDSFTIEESGVSMTFKKD
ncbi:MAG: hypothetical protein ACI39Q_08220 [Wujia sp.]